LRKGSPPTEIVETADHGAAVVVWAITEADLDQVRNAGNIDLDPLIAVRRGDASDHAEDVNLANDAKIARLDWLARRLHFNEQTADVLVAPGEEDI
jgi:hypothetical protein